MANQRVLVVEDENTYCYVVAANLRAHGYDVLTTGTGQEAIHLATTQDPNLIVLDLRLPDRDGFDVCRTIRRFSNVPIIMLTALIEPPDRIRGLQAGADDYVIKPFDMDELLARVDAALRRVALDHQPDPAVPLQVGELTIDIAHQQATVGGHLLQLTPVELKLLVELVRHLDQVLLHEHLLARVWGDEYTGELHLVHQAVSRLRRKLAAAPAHPIRIDTQYATGYICRPSDPSD
jgi:two-component system response regulator VicR